MKILNYKKLNNKYRVYLDNNSYLDLYENTILKYELLLKKEIKEEDIDLIKKDNSKEEIYDIAIKYINIKMRSKKELYNYLVKKEFLKEDIDLTIKRLEDNNILNDELYVKSYIYDRFNLSSDGPNKIKRDLISSDIDISIIDKYLNLNEEDIKNKLDKFVTKKIRESKNYNGNVLKNKLINYFYNLGYDSYMIEEVLSTKNLINMDQGIKEYNKLYIKYSKKYKGYELEMIIRQKLYQKGYNYDEIKKSIN